MTLSTNTNRNDLFKVRKWALLCLLALCDYESFHSTRTISRCEAFSTPRSIQRRRSVLFMSSTPMDPANGVSSTPSSSTSSLPSSSLPSANSLPTSSPRSKSTALSVSTTTSGSWSSLPQVSMTGATVTEQRKPKVDYQWTKQNFAIALPALLGLLADPVLSMVDTGFVGRLSSIDLAALGVCTSVFHMFFTSLRGSTVATTSLVGSAKSEQEARQITKISLQLAGVLGTIVLLVLRVGGPSVLATMGVSKTSPLYKPACDYLFARCWAAPAVMGSKY